MKKTMLLSLALISAIYAKETRLEDIVVTGTGFKETIGESNKNVTIITKKEVKDSGQTSVMDFLKTSPFITVASGDRIDIRGQGGNANRSIQVLVDGVSINSLDDSHRSTPLDVLDINDIEQIEIIPGGGAVLYGSGTRGGVINIITTKSSSKNRIGVGLMAGSHDLMRGRVNAGWNITDNIFIMGNFQKYKKDGYRRGTWEEAYFGDGAVRFKFLDNHSITLSGSYSKVEGKTADNMLTQAQLDSDRRQSPMVVGHFGPMQYSQGIQRDKKYQAKYQYNDEDLLVEAIGYYQDISFDSFDDEKKGGKLKAKYKFAKGYVIGGYDYENIDGQRGEINKVSKETNSFYALGNYNFTDVFGASLGYRFENAKYHINNRGRRFNESTDENNHAFEFVINAKYDDDGNAYFKYERGYISPSPYNRTDKITTTPPVYRINNIKSETYDTFEFGIRDLIFGQYASLTAYYTKSYDEIRINWDGAFHGFPPPPWHWINLDETQRYGLEVFFEEYVTEGLTFSQSLNFIKAKIKKGRNEGRKITYVPNFKGTFGVKYEPIKNLELFGNFVYYGNSVDNAYNKIPYYAVFDVSAKYTFYKNFSVQAGIKNLFDKKYNDYQWSSRRGTTYEPADERNYFIELSYNY